MKSKLLVSAALALTISASLATAQIKMVGDDYSSNLTGSKNYYEKDVDFEKYFPTMDSAGYSNLSPYWGSESNPYWETNLTGDTVYLPKDFWIESKLSSTVINMEGELYKNLLDFCINKEGKPVNRMMTKGYYEIVGYVFCSDNEDSIRSLYNLKPPLRYSWDANYGEYLERDISVTTKSLKDNILRNNIGNISKYIMYIVFKSLENETDAVEYYLSYKNRSGWYKSSNSDKSIISRLLPLRFYNVAKSFIGEEVMLFSNRSTKASVIDGLIQDPLSDRLVKINDSIFIVKDVVMKGNDYYTVLEGFNTGSFALPIYFIYGINDMDFDFYTYYVYRDVGDVLVLISDVGMIKKRDLELLGRRKMTAQSQIESERKQQELRIKQEKERKEIAFKQQMLAKYGTQFGEMVARRQVGLDMSKAMCRDAWGKPMNTYRTTTKYGQSEVWCYNYKTRVYFYNGKVVQIDD